MTEAQQQRERDQLYAALFSFHNREAEREVILRFLGAEAQLGVSAFQAAGNDAITAAIIEGKKQLYAALATKMEEAIGWAKAQGEFSDEDASPPAPKKKKRASTKKKSVRRRKP